MTVQAGAWDESVDIVVVGYGFAGAAAAIEASRQGANVMLVEKGAHPGGTSICSAGGVRVAKDRDEAFAYLKATNAGTAPDETLEALADGMATISEFIEDLAETAGAKTVVNWMPGNYAFEGYKTFGFLSVSEIPAPDIQERYPHVRGLRGGARLFAAIEHTINTAGIPVRLTTAAERLVTGADGSVEGVVLRGADGATKRIRANAGVILACGGFEGDAAMQAQYWQGKPVLTQAYSGNTGDGIRMAQAVGADLWHMWHYHGTYGMRHTDPAYPYGIRLTKFPDWVPGEDDPDDLPEFFSVSQGKRVPWILVDQRGSRFMNEYHPYLQDTGHRDLEVMDPVSQTHLRIPSWLVIDADGLAAGQLGLQTYNDPAQSFVWSTDNRQEVDLGILRQAETLEELAALMGVAPERLSATVEAWNADCAAGLDAEYGRIPESLVPIKTPPFYTTPLWPMVGNTQGGPVHDARQRVLNPFGEVIDGLYVAGELGSVFGHLYISGGNLAECFVGGRTATRDALDRQRSQ